MTYSYKALKQKKYFFKNEMVILSCITFYLILYSNILYMPIMNI